MKLTCNVKKKREKKKESTTYVHRRCIKENSSWYVPSEFNWFFEFALIAVDHFRKLIWRKTKQCSSARTTLENVLSENANRDHMSDILHSVCSALTSSTCPRSYLTHGKGIKPCFSSFIISLLYYTLMMEITFRLLAKCEMLIPLFIWNASCIYQFTWMNAYLHVFVKWKLTFKTE